MFSVVVLIPIFGETVRSWFRSLARWILEQTLRSSTELVEHVTGSDGVKFLKSLLFDTKGNFRHIWHFQSFNNMSSIIFNMFSPFGFMK